MPRARKQPAQPLHTVTADWRGWAIICLHEFAEPLPASELLRDFRRHLPGGSFYFPKVGREQAENPLAAYVFVVANRTDRMLLRMERSRYVEKVLCTPRSRSVTRLSDQELHRMVAPRNAVLQAGQTVTIRAGDWAGLDGVVLTVLKDRVRLRVKLWSRSHEVTLLQADVQPT